MSAQLTEKFTVSSQIALNQVQAIADEGFEVIISNRPDGEEAGQPSIEEISQAAHDAGMEFVSIPIASGQFTAEAVQAMNELIASDRKIYAFCRTGTRSAGLWALSQAGARPSEDILERTANAGYNFSQLASFLRQKDAV